NIKKELTRNTVTLRRDPTFWYARRISQSLGPTYKEETPKGSRFTMRAVLQRVSQASVIVEGRNVGEIARGWLVLLGIAPEDCAKDAAWLAEKVAYLRAFND